MEWKGVGGRSREMSRRRLLERTASVNSALSAEARRRALSPPPPMCAGGGLARRQVPAPARAGAFDDGRITQQTRSRETRTVRSMMTRKPLFQHPPGRLRQAEATEEARDWHEYDPTWGAEGECPPPNHVESLLSRGTAPIARRLARTRRPAS